MCLLHLLQFPVGHYYRCMLKVLHLNKKIINTRNKEYFIYIYIYIKFSAKQALGAPQDCQMYF